MIISDGMSQVGNSKSEVDFVFSSEYKKLRLRVLFRVQKAEPLPSLSLDIPSWGERERERGTKRQIRWKSRTVLRTLSWAQHKSGSSSMRHSCSPMASAPSSLSLSLSMCLIARVTWRGQSLVQLGMGRHESGAGEQGRRMQGITSHYYLLFSLF